MNNKYFTVETLWLTNMNYYITSYIECTYFLRKERLSEENSRNKEIFYDSRLYYHCQSWLTSLFYHIR